MGTSPDQLARLCQLYRDGAFKLPARVCDVGAQQLHDDSPFAFREFTDTFGVTDWPERTPRRTYVGDLFRAAGFGYQCLDIERAPFGKRFDLNTDVVPWRLRGRFDIVQNFGTTEHVMNQYNAFRAIHDLCKVGGLIYSYFIQSGYDGHGIVHYTDTFIDNLMRANRYDVVWEQRHAVSPDKCRWVIMRRTSTAPFKAIIDVEDPATFA